MVKAKPSFRGKISTLALHALVLSGNFLNEFIDFSVLLYIVLTKSDGVPQGTRIQRAICLKPVFELVVDPGYTPSPVPPPPTSTFSDTVLFQTLFPYPVLLPLPHPPHPKFFSAQFVHPSWRGVRGSRARGCALTNATAESVNT